MIQLNQDTDVCITGVYVNSTTRSTRHEGYCSIAGMQYRISSTSHTQSEATTVATETTLQVHASDHAAEAAPAPVKSYTPLGALSSMQPPGHPSQPAAAPPPQQRCLMRSCPRGAGVLGVAVF
ncbi:uncharacterized protein LOC124550804 [Schistocerca americana]|uniref:uncharacterized protein LOC124550804 n=1 Tax=Schistocerca americana TaxID=7009 RepID=UPI001F4F49FF|nr:uncharacterized protein LOC124550804 [Schistocerca americana]